MNSMHLMWMLRNVKSAILIALILQMFLGVCIAGTTGKISGKVTDAESGQPFPGVNVFLEGTNYGAATDLEG